IAEFAAAFPSAKILVTGVEDPATQAHGINESLHLGVLERAATAEALLLANLGSDGQIAPSFGDVPARRWATTATTQSSPGERPRPRSTEKLEKGDLSDPVQIRNPLKVDVNNTALSDRELAA